MSAGPLWSGRARRPLPGLLAGLVVFVLTLGVGLAFAFTRPVQFSARASMVVLPADGQDPVTAPGFYETLSRGQIVETFASILRLQRFESAVAQRLGVPEPARRTLDTSIQVVPNTAMIAVTVTAASAERAETMADGIVDDATTYLQQLNSPYRTIVVSRADGSAERSGVNLVSLVAVVLVVALAGAVATQQAVQQLSDALARRRPSQLPVPAQRPPLVGRRAR